MALVRRIAVLAAFLAIAAAWSGSALATGEPTNTDPPQLYGRVQVGATLTLDPGSWSGATSYTYQWQQCTGAGTGCSDIAGATGLTYVVASGDADHSIDAVVTATNAAGDTKLTAGPTFAVGTFTLTTTHFAVHYVSDPATGQAITQTQAGDVGALAERAYAAELAAGYPAPLSDGTLGGDSRIDLYVGKISDPAWAAGLTIPDTGGSPVSGSIVLLPTAALDQETVAHELFHLIQFGIWAPSSLTDYWLLEGSAEWMGYRVDGYADGLDLGDWDMSLDCRDPDIDSSQCDLSEVYKNNGYSRWPFFEYVTERYGSDFVKTIFQQGASGGGSATDAVGRAIQSKGGSLSDVFTDWTVANMTGGYTVSQLQDVTPQVYGNPILTGTASGAIPPTTVSVDHLSARYVQIDRGSGSASGPCYAATLKLSVSLPSGIGARPYFWWGVPNKDGSKQPPQPLSVDGSTATITLPWDTCDWGSGAGYLDLPNPSTSVDSADFTVTGTLTVDPTTQATATPPPDPVKMHGATVNADGAIASGVPQVAVFGPQVIRLAPDQKGLRIIVESNGDGKLQAALGSVVLGAASVRAGGNDLRFALPTKATASLKKKSRRRAATSNLLTLTPMSTGGASGVAVTRRVVLQPPAKTAAARR